MNQKVSNVLDHATSDIHEVVMTRKGADAMKASGGSAVLSSRSLAVFQHWTVELEHGWRGGLTCAL